VAEALRPLRDIADEIVVGADESVTDVDLEWYGSVADRLSTYPFTGPNQYRAWVAQQASGDWLLFLDGDEIPSRDLVDGIRPLLDDRDIAAYRTRMWWVAPDGAHVLDSSPWSPAYHCRLVRNDDRLWFPSVKHTGPETRGPTRRTELALLHLDLALQDVEARRTKVDRYETQHFGHLTDGQPTNARYYLPENRSDLDLRALPVADRRRVADVLSARTRRDPKARRVVVHHRASAADIRRTIPWHRFDDADARASIEVGECPPSVRAGGRFQVGIRVANLGQRHWPAGWETEPAVRLSYHWIRDGETVVFDGLRTVLTHPVRAGGDIELTAQVLAPDDLESVGRSSHLVFDIVAEGDRWFGTNETIEVEVLAGPKAALLAARGVDGLVPIDAALRMRSELVFPGALERALVDDDPAVELPSGLDGVLVGLPTGGWAFDRAGIGQLVRYYLSERPKCVIEFGSGTSTVVLAWLAHQAGLEGTSVISFEQDPGVVRATSESLRERGLDQFVRVVLAPLSTIELDGMSLRCHDADVIESTLRGLAPVKMMVVIDGPSRVDTGSRYPIVPLVRRHITEPATFLLDDAWRDLELTVADRWSRLDGVEVHGIVAVGKGVVIGEITPTGGRSKRQARGGTTARRPV
jgi:hypothetical protein